MKQNKTKTIDLLSFQVREALKRRFPTHEVKEFLGHGPISEQLKNFAQASLIVAPHGAGLSNVMVSPLHTPVLEIAPPSCSICYIHLVVKVLALSVSGVLGVLDVLDVLDVLNVLP